MANAVAAYLQTHADRDAVALADVVAPHGPWSGAVVVPARDETPGFIDGLAPALRDRDALAIVVINGDATDDATVREANGVLWDALCDRGPTIELAPKTVLVRAPSVGDLLVLHRTLPPKQGVGGARRIGLDLALALVHRHTIASRWLDTTDADVTLPSDYLSHRRRGSAVARVRPFTHVAGPDAGLHHATALYEITLRYYVAGLAAAGSPWAMHTIGSCLSLDAKAYAAVRGLPVRAAGEDFYLLAKLGKLGRIVRGAGPAIEIASRASSRVPFGTGPGTAAIARTLAAGETPTVYAPDSFAAVRDVLSALTQWSTTGQGDPADAVSRRTDRIVTSAFEALRPATLAAAMRGASSPARRLHRLHEWLDAFRTLKLVHRLRALGHAEVPWPEAVARLTDRAIDRDVSSVRTALAEAERNHPDAGLAPPS